MMEKWICGNRHTSREMKNWRRATNRNEKKRQKIKNKIACNIFILLQQQFCVFFISLWCASTHAHRSLATSCFNSSYTKTVKPTDRPKETCRSLKVNLCVKTRAHEQQVMLSIALAIIFFFFCNLLAIELIEVASTTCFVANVFVEIIK